MFNNTYKNNNDYYGLQAIEGLVEILPSLDKSSSKAIDIGCGQGRDSIFIAANGIKVTAIDIEEIATNQLKQIAIQDALPIITFCSDVRTYDFPENTYDIVVARTVLDHLEQDAIPSMIDRIKNCMRINGYVFITVFTQEDPGFTGDRNHVSECASSVNYYFAPNELLNFFNDYRIFFYKEHIKDDLSHGLAHKHGVAKLVAQKLN